MIFDANGEMYDGLVTVEAVKYFSGIHVNFIGLDVMNAQSERLLVYGDESRMYVNDQLRDLLTMKSERIDRHRPSK